MRRRMVEASWNVMAHGDAREGKSRGNWRMKWVASTLHATSELGVSSIITADAHTSAASSRLNWRPRDLSGIDRFAERRNLVSARVPLHFNWPLDAYWRFGETRIFHLKRSPRWKRLSRDVCNHLSTPHQIAEGWRPHCLPFREINLKYSFLATD
jgi:hypothetical protein